MRYLLQLQVRELHFLTVIMVRMCSLCVNHSTFCSLLGLARKKQLVLTNDKSPTVFRFTQTSHKTHKNHQLVRPKFYCSGIWCIKVVGVKITRLTY